MDYDAIKEFINKQPSDTKIYLGVDSEIIRVGDNFYIDYLHSVVIHFSGKKGCKVFGGVKREPDYTKNKKKPSLRLMNETYAVANLFLELKEVLNNRYVEIHLDLNPNIKHFSNSVAQQSIGYIVGMCNIIPKIKPDSFASTNCADRIKKIISNGNTLNNIPKI